MTFSILAHDPVTGQIGGAAATGSLCVGGWVLRGDPRAGVSASQGAAPSTFWGEDVLRAMRNGCSASAAVASVTDGDPGREWRQLAALDLRGGGAAHTGADNSDWKGARAFDGGIASGNLLAGAAVLDALIDGFCASTGPLHARLMQALFAACGAGGDIRGLQSAAILVVGPMAAPLTLRIDHSDAPLQALDALRLKATKGDYATWAAQVPCEEDRFRRLGDRDGRPG